MTDGAVVTIGDWRIISDARWLFVVQVLIDERLHAVVFTPRAGKVDVSSLRKANPREVRDYEQNPRL